MDIAATMLDLFGVAPPPENEGISLLPLVAGAPSPRKAAIFGYFGGAVNVTDGRYTYHRYPFDLLEQEIYQYTVMPTHMREMFTTEELAGATLQPAMPFSKGVPLMRIPVHRRSPLQRYYGPGTMIESETRLYDLDTDPGQTVPLQDPRIEARMIDLMRDLMAANHAPAEAYARLRIDPPRGGG
jgi:arylsulfatase A-like enzyme